MTIVQGAVHISTFYVMNFPRFKYPICPLPSVIEFGIVSYRTHKYNLDPSRGPGGELGWTGHKRGRATSRDPDLPRLLRNSGISR